MLNSRQCCFEVAQYSKDATVAIQMHFTAACADLHIISILSHENTRHWCHLHRALQTLSVPLCCKAVLGASSTLSDQWWSAFCCLQSVTWAVCSSRSAPWATLDNMRAHTHNNSSNKIHKYSHKGKGENFAIRTIRAGKHLGRHQPSYHKHTDNIPEHGFWWPWLVVLLLCHRRVQLLSLSLLTACLLVQQVVQLPSELLLRCCFESLALISLLQDCLRTG